MFHDPMKSSHPKTSLEWIQAKYGIAMIFLGLLAAFIDFKNAANYIHGPAFGGLLITLLAYFSKTLVRYRYTPLQINTGIFLMMFFWAGLSVAAGNSSSDRTQIFPIVFAISTCCLCYLAIFFTSCAYQDEMEEANQSAKGTTQ